MLRNGASGWSVRPTLHPFLSRRYVYVQLLVFWMVSISLTRPKLNWDRAKVSRSEGIPDLVHLVSDRLGQHLMPAV
ncbi:MAG: hypothetical protein ACJAVR_004133 [Paracoccaceae bacterium]|jgi:hypothetical protein